MAFEKTPVIIDIRATTEGVGPAFEDVARRVEGAAQSAGQAGGRVAEAAKEVGQSVQDMARQAAQGDWASVATQASRTALSFGAVGLAVGAAVGGIATLAKASADGSREIDGMNHALGMTGNFAGQTAASMRSLAETLTGGTVTIGAAKHAVTELAASGQVGAGAFAAVARATADYARATGQAVTDVAGRMERLFADPAKGAEELTRSLHFLSAAELDHLDGLTRSGQVTEAQLALAEKLSEKLAGQAQNLGLVERAWAGAKSAASAFWDVAMGIGRTPDAAALAAASEARLRYLQSDAAKQMPTATREREMATLERNLEIQRSIARLKQEEVRDAAATADYLEKGVRARAVINAASKEARMADLAGQVQLLQEHGSGPFRDSAIAALQARMTEMWKTPGGKATREDDGPFRFFRDLQLMAEKEGQALEKELARQAETMARWRSDLATGATRQGEALGKETERMREHLATLGLTGEALGNYRAQKILAAAASEEAAALELEEAARLVDENAVLPEVSRGYRELAAARAAAAGALRDQAGIARETALKQEGLTLAAEAKRQSERISQDLTQALMRGFEGGKRGAQALRDTLKNYFATLVLEPLIRPIMQPVAEKATGLGNALAGLFKGGGAGGPADSYASAWSGFTGLDIPSFDVGTDFVPKDTLAVVHRGERIVPAAENRGGGGPVVQMPLTVHIDSRTDAASVRAYVLQAASLAERRLMQSLRTGGTWAAAMGKA